MKKYNKFLLALILLVPAVCAFPQTGLYLTPYGGVQTSTISNYRDFYIKGLTFKYQALPVFGINLNYNLSDMFGIETGLRYSFQGQKYLGKIDYDVNTRDSVKVNFTSFCKLNYFQVPLLLRFNSALDEDKVYMNISAGIQFDILQKATINVEADTSGLPFYIPASLDRGTDVSDMFRQFSASFVANAGLNILLSESLCIYTGIQMSKSISDIENKSFKFDENTMAFEYLFPVGVKKDGYPQDYTIREKTKNIVYSFFLGLSFKVR